MSEYGKYYNLNQHGEAFTERDAQRLLEDAAEQQARIVPPLARAALKSVEALPQEPDAV